jgi:Cd2+/Zn2+-exporting ATPase
MTKYRIRGLDCAQCAAEVESALRKAPGLEETRLSFATQTLFLNSEKLESARAIINELEPGVTLSPFSRKPAKGQSGREGESSAEGEPSIIRLTLIAAAFVLFLIGTIFNTALHATPFSVAEYAVLLSAYFMVGWPVLASAFRSIIKGQVFNEMFLMSLATIGAIAIHQLPEAVGVMLFYSVGEYLQEKAVDKSRKSISALLDLRPESARLVVGAERKSVHPEEVRAGDLIEVLPGERVPLDGTVVEGSSYVNTSSLTGESVPRKAELGTPVLAGFVNDEGRIVLKVDREFSQSAAARILELVEDASSHKAPTEKFITEFAAVYTQAVVAISLLIAFLPPLFIPGARLLDWVYRALVILVISCPCALVVSIPLGYFGGIGAASRNKLLIKGSNYIDALAKVDTVVFDKTGTLTEGVFAVSKVATRNGFTREDILHWAAAAESISSHPIARSIREAASKEVPKATDVREIKGHGLVAVVGGKTVTVGNDRIMHHEGIEHGDCEAEGTVVFVAVDGVYAGHIVISDRVKETAAATVQRLKALGVRKVAMLTGDDSAVAARVAAETGLDAYYAELLPDGKVSELQRLEDDPARKGALVFVGDGMNDAPVLMRSDVGFAMGALGSDAAIEAADVVVMDDDISRVPEAIGLARFTGKIVVENIVFALGVKLGFIALGAVGVAGMWEAVIADVGVSLLAVLNALRTVRHQGS